MKDLDRDKNYLTNKQIKKRHDIATNNTVKCPNCGHSILITNKYKKVICSWCSHMVFADKKTEFVYRVKERLASQKRK